MTLKKHWTNGISVIIITLMLAVLCVCIPSRAGAARNTKLDLNGKNWMSGIPDDRYLYEFNIPGTHDTATLTAWHPAIVVPVPIPVIFPLVPVTIPVDAEWLMHPFAVCQDYSPADQLNRGVRFLDLRLTNYIDDSLPDGTVVLAHGDGSTCYRCLKSDGSFLTLDDVLKDVRNFLKNHPTETVILQVKEEYDDKEHQSVWKSIREAINRNSDFFYTENRWPSLGEARGKAVLCSTDPGSLGIDTIQVNLGNDMSTTDCSSAADVGKVSVTYENHWDLNKDDKNQWVKKYLTGMTQSLGRSGEPHIANGGILFSSSNFITQDFDEIISDLIEAIITFSPEIAGDWQSPRKIADLVNPTVTSFIRSAPELTYFGIVATDFGGETAETIWKSNYPNGDWDYYNKYRIRYMDRRGRLLHTDMVVHGETTTTYRDLVWTDPDDPGATYRGRFEPHRDMTLVADAKILHFDSEIVPLPSDMPKDLIFFPEFSHNVNLPHNIPKSSAALFTGWNTKKDGTGVTYMPGSRIILTDDRTLWAQWRTSINEWSVIYDANGGVMPPQTQTALNWQDIVLSTEQPANGSLLFKGWTTNPAAPKAEYQPGDTLPYVIGRDTVVLYALWELVPVPEPTEIHIAFDANGIEDAILPPDIYVTDGTWLQLEHAVAPLGGSYAFWGWSEKPDADFPRYRAGDTVRFYQDTTLYATWKEEQPLTLYFQDSQPGDVADMPDPIVILPSMPRNVRIPDRIPQKSGRVFAGWNTVKNGAGTMYEPGSDIPLEQTRTLWAQWKIAGEAWYVIYDANGGTQAPNPQVFAQGEDAVLTRELPENGALTFRGWTTDSSSAKAEYLPGDTLPYDSGKNVVILYALWELNPAQRPVHITFDANGVDHAVLPGDVWVEQGTWLQLQLAVPPLGGSRVFLGWSEDPNAKTPAYRAGETYAFTRDTTLYAVWSDPESVTLTFRDPLPDAVADLPEPISILPSMSRNVRIPDQIPQKGGRIFTGWNTAEDGSGTAYTPGSVITLRENTTLWAQWKIAGDVWYVVYNANGGTRAPTTQIVHRGEDAVLTRELPENGTLTFRGWTTDPSSAKAEYLPGDTLPYDSGKNMVVLYALWELDPAQRPVHIAFDANGVLNAKLPEDIWLQQGTWLQLRSAAAPLGSSRFFLGWSEDPNAKTPAYRAGETYAFTRTRDTTLYAVWSDPESVTLTFRDPLPDAAADLPEPISILPSMSRNVRIPDQIPQKGGRIFTGWNTAEDGSGTAYTPGSVITLRENTTLWAQWKTAGDVWYVVYNANGGTRAPATQIIRRGEDAVLTRELPENGALTFKGWTTDSSSAKAEYLPGESLPYDSGKNVVILYALWELNPAQRPVHITFDANGVDHAVLPGDVWVEQGTWLQLQLAVPPLGGSRVFLGWSEDPNAKTPAYRAGETYAFTRDTTLYAVWSDPESVTLTFRDPLPDAAADLPEPISILPSMSRNVRIPDQIPQKGGRIFTGWNTAEDGSGTAYTPGSVITLRENTTLWAQWKTAGDVWYVVYNANGGTRAPATQIIRRGEDAALTRELPENGALTFRGWTTDPQATGPVYQPGDSLPYDSGKNVVVLYALWELNPVQRPAIISFDANGGLPDTVPQNRSVPKSVWFRLPDNQPSWDPQHDFLGWSVNPRASEPEWKAGDTAAFDADTTLYAVWHAHYRVISGAGSTWTKGSGRPQRFAADGSREYFRELRVDGQPVRKGLEIISGSTIADISAETMEKLAVGGHTVTFVYMDGEASAKFSVRDAVPKTGDTANPALWFALAAAGIAGLVLCGTRFSAAKRKKE